MKYFFKSKACIKGMSLLKYLQIPWTPAKFTTAEAGAGVTGCAAFFTKPSNYEPDGRE